MQKKYYYFQTIIIISNFFLIDANVIKANPICPNFKGAINFSVKITSKPINYNLNFNERSLHNFAKRNVSGMINSRVLGLTSTRNTIISNIGTKTYKLSKNKFCSRITSLNLTIKVHKIEVYVINKYKRGSCQYSAVIDHEHEHVATYQKGLLKLKTAFQQQLWKQIKKSPASFGKTPEDSNNKAIKIIKAHISKIEKPIVRSIKQRNQEIDSYLNYRKLIKNCSEW